MYPAVQAFPVVNKNSMRHVEPSGVDDPALRPLESHGRKAIPSTKK
jgi:hypothetical protein